MNPDPGTLESPPHRAPRDAGDRLAYALTRALRLFADLLFAQRYGHRAVVLETVAAVPGMVGATLMHLRCLRRSETDNGWIRRLMDEAENERMHLMTFMQIAQPSGAERARVMLAQGVFYNLYFVLYLVAPGVAHRMVGYFEEEAVRSYTQYLALIDSGAHPTVTSTTAGPMNCAVVTPRPIPPGRCDVFRRLATKKHCATGPAVRCLAHRRLTACGRRLRPMNSLPCQSCPDD